MPGAPDNNAVFDPYPFPDIPNFAPIDPDPDPETLGLQAYQSQPAQPAILLWPIIRRVESGIEFGAILTALFYIPNEILPTVAITGGVEFGAEIISTIVISGIEFGAEITVPPVVFGGIEFGAEITVGVPQSLAIVSRWPMNEPQFLDVIGGYNFLPTTGQFVTNTYTNPIDVVGGVDGYTRLQIDPRSPWFLSPVNNAFESDNDSAQVQFEFYLETAFSELELGNGTVRSFVADDFRYQWDIRIIWNFTFNVYDIICTIALRTTSGSNRFESLTLRTPIAIGQWHTLNVLFNMTSREIQAIFNSTVSTQLLTSNDPPSVALNPGFYIREALEGSFRIRNVEYSRGVVAYALRYIVAGVEFGAEITVVTNPGGGGSLLSSWDLNTNAWTDAISAQDFYLDAYPNSLVYNQTPVVVGGTGGYTVFDNDPDFYGLWLRTPANAIFVSNGKIKFEFEINIPFLSYGNEDFVFECGDFSNFFDYQWRIKLAFDFDLEVHVIESVFYTDDGAGYFYLETARHTTIINSATWHSVSVEFDPVLYQTVITVDGSAETFPFTQGNLSGYQVANPMISIGDGYWSYPFWFRNLRYSKE